MKGIAEWVSVFLSIDRIARRLDNHGKAVRSLLDREAMNRRKPDRGK